MNTIPNPDSWSDVVTIIIVTAIVAGPTWLTARANRAIKGVHQQVSVVREQVVNGHTSPLRSDVDDMRTAVSSLRDEVRGGFSSLRADLAEERSARRDGDMSLCEEIHDRHPAVTQERTARQAGDQGLRNDLDAHLDDGTAHETR